MSVERTKPIAVKGPKEAPLTFWARQLLDFQLKTIVKCLSKKLPKLSGKILDIGAGESPWKYLLGKETVYQGIDIQSASEFGMKKSGEVIYYDGRAIPFSSNEFDAALCIEVLEHTQDPPMLLAEAFRVLKPGAMLIITVPWSARVHHIPYDYHRFTPFQLERLFTQAGFSDFQIQARGNNICTIANKLIIAVWSLFFPARKVNRFWSVPMGLAVSPVCLIFVMIAHISLLFPKCENDDPLGYVAVGRK
jgi:SAM-dependent methyltransferase